MELMFRRVATPLFVFFAMLYSMAAMAVTPPIDVSDATTYLDANVGPALIAIAGVIFTLAALAMGIKWVKATFFS